MLGKLLLTAIVIALAFTLARQKGLRKGLEDGLLSGDAADKAGKQRNRASRSLQGNNDSPDSPAQDSTLHKDLRLGAYLFLALMTGLGGALYYYQWQDDREIITVNLYRAGLEAPVSYEVFKYQLGERSFVTTDGISVTVAASERMEVIGLDN
jgi:hypothetical protein